MILHRGLVVAGAVALMGAGTAAAAPGGRTSPPPHPAPRTETLPVPSTPPPAVPKPSGTTAIKKASGPTSVSSCTNIVSPGTYTLTADIEDEFGPGPCIYIQASGVTLNMNGHTISGNPAAASTGGYNQTGILFEPTGSASLRDDVLNGGTRTPGQLTGFAYGVYLYSTIRGQVSNVAIAEPPASSGMTAIGVYASTAASSKITGVTVADGDNTGQSFYLDNGSNNQITKCTGSYDGSTAVNVFYTNYEWGDTLSGDTAKYVNVDGVQSYGGSGTGFSDLESNRITYSADHSLGNYDGFYLNSGAYGVYSVSGSQASDAANGGTGSGGYGFYVNKAYLDYDRSQVTQVKGNTANGYSYGFDDEMSENAKYSGNVATGNASEGYLFHQPAGESITGNSSTLNNLGFYLEDNEPRFAPDSFSSNHSSHDQEGFDADYAQSGTGNTAKNDVTDTANVEIQ